MLGQRDRYHPLDPTVVYVAVSVTNLERARAYFGTVVGLEPVEGELHTPGHEALWGLADARRRTALLRGGTTFMELVHYESPAGRPRPMDDGLDRQGFKTVAVGFRDPADTGAVFRRVKQAGLSWTVAEPVSNIGGNHVIGAVAHNMKTLSVPLELERQFGYSPEPEKWWRPPVSAQGLQAHDRSPPDSATIIRERVSCWMCAKRVKHHQRAWRDARVVTLHGALKLEALSENYGWLMAGLEPHKFGGIAAIDRFAPASVEAVH